MFNIIEAEAFFGPTPPARIIGTENEVPVQKQAGQSIHGYMSEEAIERAGFGLIHRESSQLGFMLDNGCSIYLDVGEHIEIDSAEALGPAQAAAADAASIITLQEIIRASHIPHHGVHRTSGTYFRGKANTSGFHENYLIPRKLAGSIQLSHVMASHLSSRLYAMAGTVSAGFQLSQKVDGIGDPAVTTDLGRRTAHGKKPMALITSTSDDVLGNPEWGRLEVRYADPRTSPTANYLAFATTSLVLRMIEHPGAVDIMKLLEKSFVNHAETATRFSKDLAFTAVGQTADGSSYSAVDYQEMLAQAANTLAERIELPDDEEAAIELWFNTCDELRAANFKEGEYGGLLGSMDAALRHRYLASRFKENELDSRNVQAWEANLSWDRILPIGGALLVWSKLPSPYVDRQEIGHLVREPPPTRATIRSNAIRRGKFFLKSATWSRLNFRSGRYRSLTDPYATKL